MEQCVLDRSGSLLSCWIFESLRLRGSSA